VDSFCSAIHGTESRTWDLRKDLAKTVSLAKSALASTEEQIDAIVDAFTIESAQNGARPQFVQDTLKILEKCKSTEDGRIDFDDMIWLPVVLNLKQRKFDRVLGDEIQDFNPAQIELMLRALADGGRFLGVGDPYQGIYRFRGADDQAFANVKARMNATELPLSVSYRCCKAVVREAQKIVPHIEAAPDADEGEVRSASYKTMRRNAKAGDFILSRTNAPLASLCMYFLANGRKAAIQGRDIGTSLAALVKKSKAQNVEALRSHIETWCDKECDRLAAKKRDTQAIEDKANCILAISEAAGSVQEVLDRIESLFSDVADESRIVLSSTHKAKGLERDRVWLLRSTYCKHPGLEEEFLLYVGVTRAKKVLVLVEGLK
jgi:DNA helicase II / ATP-dependent DNA helicase PcrA